MLGMKIQKAFDAITSWGNYVASPKTNSKEENNKKDEEIGSIGS